LLLPTSAVIYDADRNPFVDLLDPASSTGRKRVPVTIGAGNGSRLQILGGLDEGDQVVLPG
jgi:multidrug efflux pump subunit AcrA (membrane-fusion protein)